MAETKVSRALGACLAPLTFTPEMETETLHRMRAGGRERVRPRMRPAMAAALALTIVLALGAALAATMWPDFILRRSSDAYPQPWRLAGLASLIDSVKGNDLTHAVTQDGMTLRAHYCVVNGEECAVLYSLRNAQKDAQPVNERALEEQVFLRFADYPDAQFPLFVSDHYKWYDTETETLYCLLVADAAGQSLPHAGTAEMTLSVAALEFTGAESAAGRAQPVWSITAQVDLAERLPSITVPLDAWFETDGLRIHATSMEFSIIGTKLSFEDVTARADGERPRSILRLMEPVLLPENGAESPYRLTGVSTDAECSTGAYFFKCAAAEIPTKLTLRMISHDTGEIIGEAEIVLPEE